MMPDVKSAPLTGLAVVMPRPCKYCGSTDAVIGAGSGPHAASLICECERQIGWMSKEAHTFLTETVRQFGRPTKPMRISRRPVREAHNDHA
jgi:hypothetical protein